MRRPFFLIAIGLTVLLHGYIALRLLPDLPLGDGGRIAGALLFLVSALLCPMPLLLRLARMPDRLGRALAWAGYLAMGAFSTLLLLTLIRDLGLALAWAVRWAAVGSGSLPASVSHGSAWTVLGLAALILGRGFWNARRTAAVRRVTVPIEALPAALEGFTIAQLSDVHIGPTIRRGQLEAIVRRTNALDADLLALTGDIVDGDLARLREQVQPLAQLRARHGVWAVTGNHEYYHGAVAWIAEWRRLGLRVLLNDNATIEHQGARLMIAGVTDYSAGAFRADHRSDPAAAALGADPGCAVKVLLAHQPRSADAAAAAGFDLQLSGHTHGGQFIPWMLFVPMQQPFVAGLHRLRRLWVYTSRGTGYWGPPLRFGAPSEISLLRLTRAGAG